LFKAIDDVDAGEAMKRSSSDKQFNPVFLPKGDIRDKLRAMPGAQKKGRADCSTRPRQSAICNRQSEMLTPGSCGVPRPPASSCRRGPRSQTPHTPRAPRYQVGIRLRYRPIGESIWRDGQSENISHTGVLFQPEAPLSRDTPIEMMLEMPAEVADSTGMLIRRGRIVRGVPPSPLEDRPAYAAAAFEYEYVPPPDPRRI
jgi:hypothetical protein